MSESLPSFRALLQTVRPSPPKLTGCDSGARPPKSDQGIRPQCICLYCRLTACLWAALPRLTPRVLLTMRRLRGIPRPPNSPTGGTPLALRGKLLRGDGKQKVALTAVANWLTGQFTHFSLPVW